MLVAMVSLVAAAQPQNQTPTILKGPSDWRFEHLPIPPGFARDVKFTGFEEARFAPGMFDTSSSNYFTYALVVSVEGTAPVGAEELKDFLDKYYRGLSIGVGRRKQLNPDPAGFNAVVTAAKAGSEADGKFEAKVPFFDTFNDGRKIMLNLEIAVVPKTAAKRTFIVLLISPQAKDAELWKKLREVGAKANFENP